MTDKIYDRLVVFASQQEKNHYLNDLYMIDEVPISKRRYKDIIEVNLQPRGELVRLIVYDDDFDILIKSINYKSFVISDSLRELSSDNVIRLDSYLMRHQWVEVPKIPEPPETREVKESVSVLDFWAIWGLIVLGILLAIASEVG